MKKTKDKPKARIYRVGTAWQSELSFSMSLPHVRWWYVVADSFGQAVAMAITAARKDGVVKGGELRVFELKELEGEVLR